MGSGKIKVLKDLIFNFFQNRKYHLAYIVESADWSIKWDGKYITESLNKSALLKARATTTYLSLRSQIVHFGSLSTFLTNKGFKKPHWSNKVIVTCFHLIPNDSRLKFIKEAERHVDFFHTSCNITKKNLIDFGVKPAKITVVPLGVDLFLFKPVSFEKKQKIKKQLGIPQDKIVIGSFQKDGVGWGEGLEPKLIKGPDIFIKVVGKLARNYPVFILLVGPARGYVKNGLEKLRIPYKSIGYLKNLTEIAQYYHALDLYLITSRIEGGPKQILEAWASGIPVVSTKAGMVVDIATGEENILLSNIEDVNGLVNQLERIINSKSLKNKLIRKGLETVKNYSWENIARRYYKDIYSKL